MNAVADPIVKTCSCKRTYTQAQWEELPDKCVYELENGDVHEQRNCACGSTIVVVLARGEAQDPEVGAVWKSKTGSTRVRITQVAARGISYQGLSRGRSRGFMSVADFYKTFTPARRTS